MLSKTAEYALRAVICLAQAGEVGLTTDVIARKTHIPVSYLGKVLQLLRRSGLVQSQRGLHGGFLLRRAPSTLTFLEVLNSVDPLRRITNCPIHPEGSTEPICPLHAAIDRAVAAVEREFSNVTIGELTSKPSKRSPLCGHSNKEKTRALRTGAMSK